jgi:hypothetical protein
MKNIFLIIVISIFFFGFSEDDIKYLKFRGIEYDSLSEIKEFKDFKDAGGTVLDNYNGEEFVIEQDFKDTVNLIVFSTIIRTSNSTVPRYRILDILEINGLNMNQGIGYGGTCRRRTKNNSEIIAIYKKTDEEYCKNIIRAWRANRKNHKIEPISIKDIDCLNEDIGDD